MLRHSLHFSTFPSGIRNAKSREFTKLFHRIVATIPVSSASTMDNLGNAPCSAAFSMLISSDCGNLLHTFPVQRLRSQVVSRCTQCSVCTIHSILWGVSPWFAITLTSWRFVFQTRKFWLLCAVHTAEWAHGERAQAALSMIFLKGHFPPLFACLQLLSSIFYWLLFIIDNTYK